MLARTAAVCVSKRAAMVGQSRCFSSQTAVASTVALEKLRSLLEEYRMENYTRETRKRFKKEIVRAAVLPNGSNFVAAEGLQRVLQNIGYSSRMTQQEIEEVFKEVGNSSSAISIEKMIQLI